MYLDQHDSVATIVLAGAAEDLIHGLMKRAGREHETSRAQLLPAVKALSEHIVPGVPFVEDNDVYRMMRSVFNWFRHGDKQEPDMLEIDIEREAEIALYRAIENFGQYTGREAPRTYEFVQARRASPVSNE